MRRVPWFVNPRGYDSYLASDHWQAKRLDALIRADFCCEFCGQEGQYGGVLTDRRPVWLHVHHLSYQHLWNEPLEDLFVLCSSCHEDVHEFAAIRDAVLMLARFRLLGEESADRENRLSRLLEVSA